MRFHRINFRVLKRVVRIYQEIAVEPVDCMFDLETLFWIRSFEYNNTLFKN